MIISASRRTDIPAFYSRWFFNRIEAGFVRVRNPMNPRQVSHISLSPREVDGIVFWTKDAGPMLSRLPLLERWGYPCYFHFTLTGYGRNLEPGVPPMERRINAFKALSRVLGPHGVVWRYDPIVLMPDMTAQDHLDRFEGLARALAGYTVKCIFSYVEFYRKCRSSLRAVHAIAPDDARKLELAAELNAMAQRYGILLESCAQKLDFSKVGIGPSRCVDDALFTRLTGQKLAVPRDRHQRPHCHCVQSVDIGEYNTCGHGCRYCYAGADHPWPRHDPDSPFLTGYPLADDRVSIRKMNSLKCRQKEFF